MDGHVIISHRYGRCQAEMLRQLSNHWPTDKRPVLDAFGRAAFCNSKMKPQDGKGPNLAIMMDEGSKA